MNLTPSTISDIFNGATIDSARIPMSGNGRAPRNRTLTLTDDDRVRLKRKLVRPEQANTKLLNCTIHGDCTKIFQFVENKSVDLLVLDPPYNINKRFGDTTFSQMPVKEYGVWLGAILDLVLPLLKSTSSVYVCGDWHTSNSIFAAVAPRLSIRNRITWEREKGRGARSNWKNSSEDIWFCTSGEDYTFNVNDVKVRRKVIAPYRSANGLPKDWLETQDGNFRDTHPSNFWSDITIPFWSMPENTDHPTQKSEKLLSKLVLASSNPGDLVLDPFLGSGTSSVVAKKLGRRYIGIEIEEEYALLAERRLEIAAQNLAIQGYQEGVFWERNTLRPANGRAKRVSEPEEEAPLVLI